MSDELARVTKVRPGDGGVLRVRFAGDRRERQIDLTGLMARSTHFAPLMDDVETFAKVELVEDGLGVAWPVATKMGSPRPFRVHAPANRRRPATDDRSGFREIAIGIGAVADRGC
jgi:hypothetical protein